MKFTIQNFTIDSSFFILPEMSLSSSRSTMKKMNFSFQISKEKLIYLSLEEYNKMRYELEEDQKLTGKVEDLLGEFGYPNIQDVFQNDALTHEVFGCYLLDIWLSKCLTYNANNHHNYYWIDRIEKAVNRGEDIIFTGICYK
ncbi:hypothetical protein BTO06_10270 [Tenacibaculum sp. SZ-18]|uniref:hypothetical protein n=1 Tax=Tenacibaculum sp. SZ-18 TaxID=754423 RepID=UPI000C2CFEDF|nr:hypothetical protein [Tenacibaculum sp. SZ-18]AUC15501.1 hypothetical protein BTO06_10270 [Tenacibaculum sp. SZ-18]